MRDHGSLNCCGFGGGHRLIFLDVHPSFLHPRPIQPSLIISGILLLLSVRESSLRKNPNFFEKSFVCQPHLFGDR